MVSVPNWRGRSDIRKNPDELSNYLIDNKISYCYLPPVLLSQLPKRNYSNLKSLIYAGELLDKLTASYWSNKVKLQNIYGPTEATIYTCHKLIEIDEVRQIGKALSNTKLYILDTNNQPVPVGVVGELYIGGAGLARGYLNRSELTSERFVDNPFATESDIVNGYMRLYKTGDLVRRLPDGNIEYIGRNDFQVKIRGYRIELGEVESQLTKLKGVKQSVVLTKENSETKSQYLVGYYVPDQLNTLKQEELLNQLTQMLPEYMLPSVLIEMESFPLTVNGKLDRKALPDPEFVNEDNYVSPRNELEEQMCAIWAEVLGLEKISVTDDFFKLGGNSILAIKLSHILSKELGRQINVADVFRFRSVQKTINGINELSIIKPFYKIYDINLSDLLLIHPGGGGCEVYTDLAGELENKYNCIGIDNYNLVTDEEKVLSLTKLSELYLNRYLNKYDINHNKSIYLLGWSLGGQIALEMAGILESKGIKNIKVFLLDTILIDSKIKQLNATVDTNKIKDKLRKFMIEKYDILYVDKIISIFDIEQRLSEKLPTKKLINSEVILLKASIKDNCNNTDDSDKLNSYIISLRDNNVSSIVSKLRIINIDAHHRNIIEKLALYKDILH